MVTKTVLQGTVFPLILHPKILQVIVKALLRVCMENTARGDVTRDSCSTRRSWLLYDSWDTDPRAVFFIHTSIGGALSDILYFLVVWLREIFCCSSVAAYFGDQDISKCLNNLFLVVKRTYRISLAVLVNYSIAHVINHARSESYLKGVVIRRSLSVYTIYFHEFVGLVCLVLAIYIGLFT